MRSLTFGACPLIAKNLQCGKTNVSITFFTSEVSHVGVIAPFPGYELLKSPFPEFAFSPGGDLVIIKQ